MKADFLQRPNYEPTQPTQAHTYIQYTRRKLS